MYIEVLSDDIDYLSPSLKIMLAMHTFSDTGRGVWKTLEMTEVSQNILQHVGKLK